MRIAFLAPHLKVAGGTRIILEYASRLAACGHGVTVYVQSGNIIRRTVANVFHLGYPNWIANFRAHVVRVPTFTPDTIKGSDVLVATTYKTALTIADFPQSAGRQFYLLQHDEGLYHGPRELVDRAYRLPQKKIVVATWLQELLKEKYGQDAELLLNPTDRSLFHPVRSRTRGQIFGTLQSHIGKIKHLHGVEKRGVRSGSPAESTANVPSHSGSAQQTTEATSNEIHPISRKKNDGIRILLLDHTYEWKGTKEGVAIVSALKQKYPEIRLIGFGARKEASEYSFDEYYYNLPQEELAFLYSNCDIFLCPSWDEGFGLPSLEAMACKTAVVTYGNGGSRDFAFHEKTALVAPRRDTKGLYGELERLVKDKTLREKLAQGGYEFVATMPTWEEQTIALEKILSSL